ncbi:serine/threonine protein kinase [Stagnimonas aquatica]|uniref:Serine/threonine protein kinase n=1 Tax=Stagnimonas aquatica TaxID=2689987 RepID=A0A3N0V5F1_9GAMM|nr:serine/threonine-protein kinase [Stagnimonas aquatica]ROH87905.1 serine/threonine protein kinase [Stagnimonas aquatica]
MKPETDSSLPPRIGPYRILGVLGEGSQGRVYRAEQDSPRREVALKVLRRGARLAEDRFRREIALLARLEHPGIARLYAAGEAELTDGGVSWFAMELVTGRTLADHAQGLDLRGRLALVAAIGHAVHHAHVRGVVHRDLKPANILVDPEGQPKVLDFGMAHAALADETRMTAAGQVLGTIAYMPPEALFGESEQADARGDIYSLGVIAYELLSGQLPYPDLSRSSLVDAIRRVRGSGPRPLGEVLPAARGDVETIVMKALAPELGQRYATAAEFASDIERHLAGQAIAARPPTPGYLLGLFVRRHRLVSALALALVLAVIGGAAVSLRYALAERGARQQAEQRAEELAAVNGFLHDSLTGADPFRTRGRELTVRELLDGARQSLETNASLPPAALASLYEAIGGTYTAIGENATAAALIGAGRARLASALPADSLAARDLQRADLAARYADGKSAELLDAAAALLASWPDQPRAPVAEQRARLLAMKLYAGLLAELSRYDEALPLIREAGLRAHAVLPAQDVLIYQLGQDEVSVLRFMGRGQDSKLAARKLLAEEDAALGKNHPLTFAARHEMAWIAQEEGQYEEAEQAVTALIADLEAVYGRGHYATQHSLNLLGLVRIRQGRYLEAETICREAADTNAERLGANHPETLAARANLATALYRQDKLVEAEAMYRANIRSHQETGHGEQSDAVVTRNNLARLLATAGRLQEAEQVYLETLAIIRKVMGEAHPHYSVVSSNFGETLYLQKRYAEARTRIEEARPKLLAAMGPESPFVKTATERLLKIYAALGLKAEAEKLERAVQAGQ